MDFIFSHMDEPDTEDEVSAQLLARMGCAISRARPRPKTPKEVIVSEIYFPLRIIKFLREMRI